MSGRPSRTTASHRTRLLAVLSLGWATLQCGRFLLPPLLPRIQATLALSPAAVGLALTAFGLVYAVTQYPSGTYSDSLSRATLILPGFLVLLLAFAFVGIAVHPVLFVVGVVLLGIGKGLFASPSRALVGDLYDDRQGRALGIYSAGTDVGGLAASGLAVLVFGTTWRAAFAPVVVGLALVTALFALWNREPVRWSRDAYAAGRERLRPGETVRRVLATPAQRERLAAYAVFYFVVGGLINFYPTLLVASGFSGTLASASFALIFVLGMVTKPAAGALSDRASRLPVSIAGLLVAAVGFAVILLAESLAVLVVGTALAALGYKTQFPISDAVVMEAAPEENVGGDLGAARGLFLGANALGPGFVGVVAQVASYSLAFWALAVGLVASAGILARQYWR